MESPALPAHRRWVVLKFGGTSVSTPANWSVIAGRAKALLPTNRVWIVASALSQVSNRLELAIAEALTDADPESLDWIRQRHVDLADGIGVDALAMAPVLDLLDELGQLLHGIRLTREASPRLRARVMSFGELASTHLGAAALAHHGLSAQRVDARDLLVSTPVPRTTDSDAFLEAQVDPRRDTAGAAGAAGGAEVVITQGFIARTNREDRRETCLLGRGGSDTSAALFAALVGAVTLEIWTDVHGLFTTDPRRLPTARLIRRAGYRVAQELAAMGAKVLHPRCLGPAAWAQVPIVIRNTEDPSADGTWIGGSGDEDDDPAVLAVVQRHDVTLLTISTLAMWGTPGFLARAFAPFHDLGISVDLVATSQSAVSVTLDRIPEGLGGAPFRGLLDRLEALGEVEVVHPCAVVSIVGRRIRTVLHELGPAMAAFREHRVHLVSESSEDLNISFVVDEEAAGPLVVKLHERLFDAQGAGALFGPSWELLRAHAGGTLPTDAGSHAGIQGRWWSSRAEELTDLCADGRARYVYDLATVREQAKSLVQEVTHVDRFYFAMKANSHPKILLALGGAGLGMECVSTAEVRRVREVLGDDVPVLFTPNFCPIEEYGEAIEMGAEITLDGPHLLRSAPDLFAGVRLGLRIDPGEGLGHHEKVRTAGAHAKFGHPPGSLEEVVDAAAAAGAIVVGLHAHAGSGILDPDGWRGTAGALNLARAFFPEVEWLDLGGGLGVAERPGQLPLDLAALNESLREFREQCTGLQIRMEPGRFLVAESGVLLAPVTQVRAKGDVRFVGVATGMNSLIRPALYGAWHGIHNLTRLGDSPIGYAHVVGPICETGDVLGRDRLLPATEAGDVLLIDHAGAYGRAMSSNYNLREPAEEVVLG